MLHDSVVLFPTLLVSPVRNHPSEVNSFLVASGFPQYSLDVMFDILLLLVGSKIPFFFKPEHIWPFDQELSLLAVKRGNLTMAFFMFLRVENGFWQK